jgi:hypothetical protein
MPVRQLKNTARLKAAGSGSGGCADAIPGMRVATIRYHRLNVKLLWIRNDSSFL